MIARCVNQDENADGLRRRKGVARPASQAIGGECFDPFRGFDEPSGWLSFGS